MSRSKAKVETERKGPDRQDPRHAHQPEQHEHQLPRAPRLQGAQRRIGLPAGADRKRIAYGYRTSPRSGG
jgi:hypothetical protein